MTKEQGKLGSGSSKRLKFQYDPFLLVLPRRFMNASVSTIINEDLKTLAQHYINNFEEFYRSGHGLGLFGKPGMGKTFVAAAVARELAQGDRHVPIFWADTVEMFNKILDYKDLYCTQEFFTLRSKLTSTPLVVLDDFGQLRDFSRIRELFFEIVNYRYSNRLPTIFTANFTVGKTQKEWAAVDGCFNSSLTRRIYDMTSGLVFVG